MIRIRIAATLGLAATTALAQARDTVRAAPIVVSATRAPISLSSLPVAVTVIRGEDLRARGVTTVADALNDVSSAYIAQTGSQGGTTSLFLRGGESKYVKVLIDGVPVNDPGGVYDFASLTTDNLDRIEIVRGPVSVVHGADAVTGVVQIFTKSGSSASSERLESEVRGGFTPRTAIGASTPKGTSNVDLSVGYSGSLPSGSFSLGFAGHVNNGLYELNNRYRNRTTSALMTMHPTARSEYHFALRYTEYQYNYPTNSAGDVVDDNAFRTEDRTSIGIVIDHRPVPGWRATMALASSLNDGGTDDGDDGAGNSYVSQDKVRRNGADIRVQRMWSRAVATVGFASELQDQRSQAQSQSTFGPFYSLFKASRKNTGGYGELVLSPGERITATVGGRVDDNERFGTFVTGRAGLSWRPASATRLRASAGSAFREPSFFENYATGFVTGNPGLSPERAWSVDAGVEQDLASGRVFLAATVFHQRFRDMIDYSGGGACGFSYCNVAEAMSDGLETEARGRLIGPLTASVAATFLETEVITPGFDASAGGLYHAGEALIRRPATKWSGELAWRNSRPLSASVRVLAVSPRADRDFHFPASPVTLPSYQRVDAGAEYRALDNGRSRTVLTMRVENLLDEGYQNVFNFLAPRRTVSVGVRRVYQQ